MTEIWLPVIGYEGFYEVSDLGNVRSLVLPGRGNQCGRTLKQVTRKGYREVHLCVSNKSKIKSVARMVASAFIPNPSAKPTVNHKNGIKTDNRVENLEWATLSENTKHAYDIGINICNRQRTRTGQFA